MQQLFIDTHAHYYPGCVYPSDVAAGHDGAIAELNWLVMSTLGNMNRLAPAALKVVCFTDWGSAQGFEALRALVSDGVNDPQKEADNMRVRMLDERLLLVECSGRRVVSGEIGARSQLAILTGTQFKSTEGLEVLGLGISQQMLKDIFAVEKTEALPAHRLIQAINDREGVAVIPWSFGKWWLKRGQMLRELAGNGAIQSVGSIPFRVSSEPLKFLVQRQFAGDGVDACSEDLQELAGSDPLPLVGEGALVGSFGSLMTQAEIPVEAAQLNSGLILKLLKDLSVKKVTLGPRNTFKQAAHRYYALRRS